MLMLKGKKAQFVSRRIHQLWEDGWCLEAGPELVLSSPGWFKSSRVATIKQRKITIMSRSQVSRMHSAKTYWIHHPYSKTWQPVPKRRRKPDGDPYLGYHVYHKNWRETVQFVCQWAVRREKQACDTTTQEDNLPTFTLTNKRTVSKDKTRVEVFKDDCALFLRLYIACQIREGNAEDFFKYENQPWPPSLLQLGQLRGGQKADLALCLPSTSAEIATQPVTDVVILDGTAVVQMLQPGTAHTFDEYLSAV